MYCMYFQRMAEEDQFSSVIFIKIDVDELGVSIIVRK